MTRGKALVKRGADGLMPAQREYLQALIEAGSEAEARERLNLTHDRVNRWLQTDDAFKRAYEEHSRQVVEVVQAKARVMSEKATKAIDRLLDEMKPFKVTLDCKKCGTTNTTVVQVRDATTRAKVAETIWKATGVLKDRRVVEGEVGVVHMTVGQKMALVLYRDGKQISEQARRDLIGMRLIEDEEPEPDFIEGEAKEL